MNLSGNNLYIVESSVARIDVCDFEGSHRTSVVSTGLRNPRGIALDPTVGYAYAIVSYVFSLLCIS